MNSLQVSLLGRFAVELDGRAIEIRARASQSLFAYLILNREVTHRREMIAGKFWPDSDETNARNNLRHALWQIRSALGQDIFVTDKVTVAVDPKIECRVDVELLSTDTSASLDEMLAAVGQYHGDLLPGFYDDWVILERERLRAAYAQLMERLIEELIEAKRWGELSEWAERWIAMGHVPEPAFRALMIAHAARGDQAGVAAVYIRCVETLERELGVEPSTQTRLLHEQLLEEGLAAVLEAEPARERYVLQEKIGRGGMGEVYRAIDTWLERDVAIKVLSSEALGPEGRERLLAEAQAAARLNHPNVVSVYDIGEMDGQPFIVMELVEGETLHDHRPESQAEMLAIVLEICAALEHAHAQGIVHRDLKPENVMLAPDGMARLMDFGLASRTIAAPGAPEGTAGTVYYLAPEVLQGASASPQSDLYALGVLLYEILTGELPFTGEDPLTVIRQHLEVEPVPPSELNQEIRPALEALILRLLSKKPADRPLNAASVAEVLEAVAPDEVKLAEPAPGEPPFKGLEYYDVDDAEIFFGREALVERLIDRLRGERFLAVIVGASGSGKSSIARAGLVPALRDGEWIFRLMTPTEQPLDALSEVLVPQKEDEAETAPTPDDLARDPTTLHQAVEWLVETEGAERLLLVVDQLEELFTLCDEEAQRTAFIDNLLTAVDPEVAGPTVVVITLRADFYPHCAAYPALREALARNQEYIGPMNTSELRRAIEEPALRGGWKFQSGLVDLMLRDVRGEPGALPLLSHALLETWKRRSRRTLTLRGYAEAGGVRRAIARSAEQVYHQELSEEQRGIARNVFLRLTELGEGTEDTRRRVTRTELIPDLGQNGRTEGVLATLAEARLITLSEEHVEVAHEALIREWPRLREWLDEDREGLRIHRHLTEAAQAWEALGRDPGELYRGSRLAQVSEWAEKQKEELNPLERSFLDASKDESDRREKEREARRRRTIAGLAAGMVIALVLALLAGLQWQRAEVEEHEASQQASILLAAQAETELENGYTDRAVLLALEALENYPYTPQAEKALGQAVSYNRALQHYSGHESAVTSVAWSPDGTRIASSSTDNTVHIWDASTGEDLLVIDLPQGITGNIFDMALTVKWSPDGENLLIVTGDRFTLGSQDFDIMLWDATSGEQIMSFEIANRAEPEAGEGIPTWFGHFTTAAAADFAPLSGRLATLGGDNSTIVWDASLQKQELVLVGHENDVNGVDWSPDEQRLATASEDGTVRIWDSQTGVELTLLTGHEGAVNAVVWSPDGTQLGTGGDDGTVLFWDAETGKLLQNIESTGGIVWSLAWSMDGSHLAIGTDDAFIRIWDVASGMVVTEFRGHSAFVSHVAWSPIGDKLASAGADGIARIWNTAMGTAATTLPYHFLSDFSWSSDGRYLALPIGDWIFGTDPGKLVVWDVNNMHLEAEELVTEFIYYWAEVKFSPDDRFILARGGPGTGMDVSGLETIHAIDVLTGETVASFTATDGSWIRDHDWSPDGRLVAGATIIGTIYIWDFQTGDLLNTMIHGDQAFVNEVEWSPDGTKLASAAADSIIWVWDAAKGEELFSLVGHEPPAEIMSVTWSPDGNQILTTSGNPDLGAKDNTVRIWDGNSGEELLVIDGHSGYVAWGDWSPNSGRIVTISKDNTTRIWDATSGAELLVLSTPILYVGYLEWSPDGNFLAVGGDTGAPMEIWRVWQSTEELIAYAKECCVIRELTDTEREMFGLP